MKKILLTTSALAGVVLVAGTAAAEAPTVAFTGSTDYYVRFADSDFPANVNRGEAGPGWDINQHAVASELVWDVNATADNGLQFGANVQVRYAGALATDEAWIDFAGSWGRVVIGDDDGAGDNTQVQGAVDPVAAWDTGRFTGAVNGPAGYNGGTNGGMIAEGGGDNSKIAYYSPSFAGFSGAVSIMPSSQASFGGDNAEGATAVTGFGSLTFNNVTEAALNYSGTFSDVGVRLHGAYQWADTDTGNGDRRQDVGAYQLGANVAFAGFTVGAGYGDNDDSGCTSGLANCDAGDWWNAGVAYNFGAGSVGISYSEMENNQDGGTRSDEQEAISLTASYTVAQGLTAYGGVGFFEQTDGDVAANQTVDSTVFVLGTRVNF